MSLRTFIESVNAYECGLFFEEIACSILTISESCSPRPPMAFCRPRYARDISSGISSCPQTSCFRHSHLQARFSSCLLFFSHRPSLTSKIVPSLSLRDISVPTIPRDKGSDISPTPPTVDLQREIDGSKELGGWY